MNAGKLVRSRKDGALTQPFSIVMVCFFAVNFGIFNAAHRTGNWVALRIEYGGARVAREHLEVVADKNDIIVSNGDKLLSGTAAIDRTIMVAGWMVSALLIGAFIFAFLFPRNERDLSKVAPGWVVPALGLSLFEFFYITFGPLIQSEAIAAVTVIGSIASAWVVHWFWDR